MDWSVVAIFIPIVLGIIGVAFGYGFLTHRVKASEKDIERECGDRKEEVKAIRDEFKEYRDQNRQDHKEFYERLETMPDEIVKKLNNGHGNTG